jgi:DNA-binding beta-propeller fold protein YncE
MKQFLSTGGLIIRTSLRTFISLVLCVLFGTGASAHPGSGIVVDRDGNVFFTDTGQGVWKIDNHGKLTFLPAQLFHWMAIDEAGFFAGSQKNFGEWFERVTPQNTKPVLMMCSDFPLTFNRDGNLYYADTRNSSSRIIRRTPYGTETVLAGGEMFHGITGIAAGPDGSLYVTDASRSANIIRKITMDGKVSIFAGDFVSKAGSNDPPPETEPTYCRGLVVDSQGNVYVSATGRRSVLKITSQGNVTTILQAASPWSPTGVAVFRGEVYVLEWKDSSPSQTEVRRAWIPRVRKVGLDGKITILATVSR